MARKNETAEQGWNRRLQILERVASLKGTDAIAPLLTHLSYFAEERECTRFRPEQDPEHAYLTKEYLVKQAEDIRITLRRMYFDMTSKGKARAHEYMYKGTLEPK